MLLVFDLFKIFLQIFPLAHHHDCRTHSQRGTSFSLQTRDLKNHLNFN
jgi:hypothetical protein